MPSVSPLQQTSVLRCRFPLQETGRSAAASRKVEAILSKLKPLAEQVIVITGASSGISLVTARMAAAGGAAVVLAARNEGTLKEITDDIKFRGARPSTRRATSATKTPCGIWRVPQYGNSAGS